MRVLAIVFFGVLAHGPAFGATFYCAANCTSTVAGAFIATNGDQFTVDNCAGGLGAGQTNLIYSQAASMQDAANSLQTQCDTQSANLEAQYAGTTYTVPQEGDIFCLDDCGNGYLCGHEDGVSCTAGDTHQTTAVLYSTTGAGQFSPINDCKLSQ